MDDEILIVDDEKIESSHIKHGWKADSYTQVAS